MFGRKGQMNVRINTILGADSIFHGNLECEGAVRIDGRVEGNVKATGLLTVGAGGYVGGSVDAQAAVIGGEVCGNVIAPDRTEVTAQGKVWGDISTRVIVIDENATFQGRCDMKLALVEENRNKLKWSKEEAAKKQEEEIPIEREESKERDEKAPEERKEEEPKAEEKGKSRSIQLAEEKTKKAEAEGQVEDSSVWMAVSEKKLEEQAGKTATGKRSAKATFVEALQELEETFKDETWQEENTNRSIAAGEDDKEES